MRLLLYCALALAAASAALAAQRGFANFKVNFSYSTAGLGTNARIVGTVYYGRGQADQTGRWMRAEYRDMNRGGNNGEIFLVEVFDYKEDRRYSFGLPLGDCPCETTTWTAPQPLFYVPDDTSTHTNSGVVGSSGFTNGCRRWDTVSATEEVFELWLVDTGARAGRPCRAVFRNGAGTWNFDSGIGPYGGTPDVNIFGASSDTWSTDNQKTTKFDTFPDKDGNTNVNCPEPICNAAVDLVFVFDESGSIDGNEFNALRDFAKALINKFEFGPGKVFGANVYFSGRGQSRTNQNNAAGTNNIPAENNRKWGCRDDTSGANGNFCSNNIDCCAIWSRSEPGNINVPADGGNENAPLSQFNNVFKNAMGPRPWGFGLAYNAHQDGFVPSGTPDNSYQGMRGDKATLIDEINTHSQTAGYTCIGCGIRKGLDTFKFFDNTVTGQNRRAEGIKQVMVVLTDGALNREMYTFVDDIQAALNYGDGIEMFAIGVTNGVVDCQLRLIAGCATNDYKADDFSQRCNRYDCRDCDFPNVVGGNSQFKCEERIFNAESFSESELNAVANGLAKSLCQPLPSTGNECLECESLCACGSTCQCPSVCDDGDACTLNLCAVKTDTTDGTDGRCKFNPVNAAELCDDNDLCTKDTCSKDGTKTVTIENIQFGFPSTQTIKCKYEPDTAKCADTDVCTTESCDPVLGCQTSPVKCDDGLACTKDECISAGNEGCRNTPITCAGDTPGTVCRNVTCSEGDGNKIAPGSCVVSEINCDDSDPCTTDSCDAVTGVCTNERFYTGDCRDCVVNPPKCDDSDVCTDDSCDDGPDRDNAKCVYTPNGDACCLDERKGGLPGNLLDCDDGAACTKDSCDSNTGCINVAKNPATFGCCQNDTGLQLDCTPTDPCFVGSCDQNTGECTFENVGGCCNLTCVDTDPCTVDSCFDLGGGDAECRFERQECCDSNTGGPLDCSSTDPCVTGSCDADLDGGKGACVFERRFQCCDSSSGKAEVKVCPNDPDLPEPCTVGKCTDGQAGDPSSWTGGTCSVETVKNANGNSLCTTCRPDGTNKISCDDSDPCTLEKCVNPDGCQYEDKCTSDALSCTIDGCDPATGTCFTSPACTRNADDGCNSLECVEPSNPGVGDPICERKDIGTSLCDDGNACTVDSCTSTGPNNFTCTYEPACPNLDDSNPCTTDYCQDLNTTFECRNDPILDSNPEFCNDQNPCTVDFCDENEFALTGPCQHVPWNQEQGGNPSLCDDDDACTINTCNPQANVTGRAYNPNGDSIACQAENLVCLAFDTCSIPACAPQEVTRPGVWCGNGAVCCNTDPSTCPDGVASTQAPTSATAATFAPTSQPQTAAPTTATFAPTADPFSTAFNSTVVGCYSVVVIDRLDACLVCGGDGVSCFLSELEGSSSTTVIGVAAGVGIGVAALVAVALLVYGGRQGYQYFANASADSLGAATQSPIFEAGDMSGQVPDLGVEME